MSSQLRDDFNDFNIMVFDKILNDIKIASHLKYSQSISLKIYLLYFYF
jgi:hypothetical protein